MAKAHEVYSRVRWVVPMTLAISAVLLTVFSFIILATNFTDESAPLVRVLLFGVVPALGLLSMATATSASRRFLRTPWLATMWGIGAIASACWAHMTWYSQIDSTENTPGTAVWIVLIAAAILLASIAVATLLVPIFFRAGIPWIGSAALGVGAGAVVGGLGTAFLAVPAAGAVIAAGSLVFVLMLRRGDLNALESEATAVANS